MQNHSPTARYTSNGFSHSSLKERAKKLARQEQISLTQARKQIAKEIGYKNWNEILNEATNPHRDSFFHRGFSKKQSFQVQFEQYLRNKNITNSLKNYREFLIHQYKIIESTYNHSPRVQTKKITIESAAKEFYTRLHDQGPESLLPQHMPDYLLQPFKKILSEWIYDADKFEENADSDSHHMLKLLFEGVATLMATKVLLKNPSHPNKFEFSPQEVCESMVTYHLQLELESIRRKTNINITRPSLENVLDPNSELIVNLPEETLNLITEELNCKS